MFLLKCPCSCGDTFLIDEEMIGKAWHCPDTGQEIRIGRSANEFHEADWLRWREPRILGDYLTRMGSPRKGRLLLCAFARCFLDEMSYLWCREAVETAELFVDGQTGRDELEAASRRLWSLLLSGPKQERWAKIVDPVSRVLAPRPYCYSTAVTPAEKRAHCDRIRDIFGNPFRRPTADPFWRSWREGTISRLAQGVYDDRAFDRLPILADALEDAGCDNAYILAHCRSDGEHVRGCWVVDLLLGKE
jgi:hypothetical protein